MQGRRSSVKSYVNILFNPRFNRNINSFINRFMKFVSFADLTMKLKWLLSLSILLTCCEISLQGLTHLLAKKFVGAKFFKKMKALKQCDLVWENVEHPHCETTWDR